MYYPIFCCSMVARWQIILPKKTDGQSPTKMGANSLHSWFMDLESNVSTQSVRTKYSYSSEHAFALAIFSLDHISNSG